MKVWESKWDIHLQKTITQLEWRNIWCAVNHRINNYRLQSGIWEMIHRNYISAYSLIKKMNHSDGKCRLYRGKQMSHLFIMPYDL